MNTLYLFLPFRYYSQGKELTEEDGSTRHRRNNVEGNVLDQICRRDTLLVFMVHLDLGKHFT